MQFITECTSPLHQFATKEFIFLSSNTVMLIKKKATTDISAVLVSALSCTFSGRLAVGRREANRVALDCM